MTTKTITIEIPPEIDPPKSLLPDLIELRDGALEQNDFGSAVLLSHIHAWLFQLSKALDER